MDGIRDELFRLYPTPNKMKDADVDKLSKLLQPLGLYNKRAQSLKRFSKEWVDGFKSYSKHEIWLEFTYKFVTDITKNILMVILHKQNLLYLLKHIKRI